MCVFFFLCSYVEFAIECPGLAEAGKANFELVGVLNYVWVFVLFVGFFVCFLFSGVF